MTETETETETGPRPWCQARTVAELRAALAAYPNDLEVVDDGWDPVVIAALPAKPADLLGPAVPPYLQIGGLPPSAGYHGRDVLPGELFAAHMGAPPPEDRPMTGPPNRPVCRAFVEWAGLPARDRLRLAAGLLKLAAGLLVPWARGGKLLAWVGPENLHA